MSHYIIISLYHCIIVALKTQMSRRVYTLRKDRSKDQRSYLKKLFHDIVESISGTEQDFTRGKLSRAILLLSIPLVLEMVMESVFAIVDIYFVSKLGADAVATVGITESLMTIIYAIAIGLSMATTAMVSRRIGEKDHKGAGTAAFQSIITAIFISILIAVPGFFMAHRLLLLMGTTTEIAESLSGYTAFMIGGNVVIMLLFIINAIFRSAGDAAISMRVVLTREHIRIDFRVIRMLLRLSVGGIG